MRTTKSATEPITESISALASGTFDAPSEVPASIRLAAALSAIERSARRRIRRDLGVEPLSGAQVELLRTVAQRPGIGVSGAARELRLAGNSVSTLVNHLAGAGFLDRVTDPADRRAVRLTVTRAGADRLARWADRRGRLFTEQFALLAKADRDRLEAALPALLRLADGFAGAGAFGRGEPDGAEPAPGVPSSAQTAFLRED